MESAGGESPAEPTPLFVKVEGAAMTEEEWLACDDPQKMLTFLGDRASDRKLRLFAVACCRRVSCCWSKDPQRTLLEMVELFAEGLTPWESVSAWSNYNADECPVLEAAAEAGPYLPSFVINSSQLAACWAAHPVGNQRGTSEFHARAIAERSSQARIVGCVFGNPFRPITIDLAWLTATVVSVASCIYSEKAFDHLPILADALEEATCDDPDILAHCRGLGLHQRGCWVLDLVLGKK